MELVRSSNGYYYQLLTTYNLGINNRGQTFYIGLCFLSGESEEEYNFALQHYVKVFGPNPPAAIGTDCDQALIKSVAKHFPQAAMFLCIWHCNKNVNARVRTTFSTAEEVKAFNDA